MKKHYVSNSQESTRMFKSDLLELTSRVHFIVPLLLYIPVIFYLISRSILSNSLTFAEGLGLFFSGLFLWTIVEYVMHRFVFHFKVTSTLGKRIHFIFHGVHHDYPKDKLRLVLPPIVSIPLALFFYYLFSLFIKGDYIYPFFAAFLMGYLIYDMVHYAIHHVQLKGKIWNVLKTHHLKHHYLDPSKGFGVSNPLWDEIAQSQFTDENKLLANNN